MNGGAAGGAAGGAIAALYNSRIRRWVEKVDGIEYFFVLFPDKEKPFQEQPIVRITSEDMEKWEASVRRVNIRATIGLVFTGFSAFGLLVLFEMFNPFKFSIWLIFSAAVVACLIPSVLALFWIGRVEKKEIELRKQILGPYGTYDPSRVWTALGKYNWDPEAKLKYTDYLLMTYDEEL